MGGKGRAAETYVALMRGLNVGSNNRLPMVELRAIFDELGCASVESYIQSGNVIFEATPALAKKMPSQVQTLLAERYGYRLPVILRTHAELSILQAQNPFAAPGQEVKYTHLMCLAREPDAAQCATLERERFAPDSFEVRGKDVYLYYPNGTARSKLTNAYFDKKLNTTSTVRNWNTLTKLVERSRR